MKKHILVAAVILLVHHLSFSQSASCTNLKNGTFYSYPNNTHDQWKIIREGKTEKYINLVTGDTAVWNLTWQNDCQFKIKYASGGSYKKEELELFKKHSIVFSVPVNNANYYIADYYLDQKSKFPFLTDTVWKKERPINDKMIFTEVPLNKVRQLRLKDTSQYALLYVYRSGKLIGFAADFLLKCEGVAMAGMSNRSTYVFKILKEGKLDFVAQTIHHQDKIDQEVQFGKKYFLKCDIKLAMQTGGKPILTFVDKEKGETEFIQAQ